MKENYVYIYYQNTIPIYVGRGKGNRMYQHLIPSRIKARESILFYNKLNKMLKNNETPIVKVLRNNLTLEESKLVEEIVIQMIGRRDLNNGTLCNLTNGGEGHKGYIKSEELKNRISQWSKGKKLSKEHVEKLKIANTGKKASKETKLKISLATKGISKKPFSEEHINNMKESMKKRCSNPEYLKKLGLRYIKKVNQLDINGNLIKQWNNHIEAAKMLNGRSDRIIKCCNNLTKTHKNYIWTYVD